MTATSAGDASGLHLVARVPKCTTEEQAWLLIGAAAFTQLSASFQRPVPACLLPWGVILLCSQSGTESGWVHLAPRAVTLPRTKILLGSCQVLQWILSSWSPAFAGDWKGRERRKRTKNKPNKQDALPVFPNTQPRMPDLRLGPQYLVLTPTVPRV